MLLHVALIQMYQYSRNRNYGYSFNFIRLGVFREFFIPIILCLFNSFCFPRILSNSSHTSCLCGQSQRKISQIDPQLWRTIYLTMIAACHFHSLLWIFVRTNLPIFVLSPWTYLMAGMMERPR